MEAQLKKGVLEMCVTHIIRDQAMYGYDIMKRMKQYFPEVNESTFYAILRRLHADGKAEVVPGQESNGPVRKYYRATKTGQEILEKNIAEWFRIAAAVSDIGISD